MFSRVVSNFRKKTKSSRKALKSSISSPEVKSSSSENQCGRSFSAELDLDGILCAPLSPSDNVCCERQNTSLSLSPDKSRAGDSGANNFLVNQ